MQAVIDDFNVRKIEIDRYFDFIEKLENDYIYLNSIDTTQPPYNLDSEHLKIFKANGFLILYNIIESTIANCIISIFDEIASKKINNRNIAYIDVTEKIKKYWLKNKYNHDDNIKKQSVVNQFYTLCEEITTSISFELTRGKFSFGGNLNARKIREIAAELGVQLLEPHYRENLHGEALVNIKRYRNDLAHGTKSFSEIGKNITYIGDGMDGTRGLGLIHFKNYTIEHLTSFIGNISTFITNENYLRLNIV